MLTVLRQPARALATFAIATGLAATASVAPSMAQKIEPVTIRLAGDHSPPPHPAAIAQEFFKERLEKVIPGSTVRLYAAGALYTIPEAVEAMLDGNLEMAWGQFGKTAQIDPYMNVVVGPMLLTTPGAMNQLDSFDTMEMIQDRFAKVHGIKMFGTGHLSMFMGAGAGKRLLEPKDFQGQKIRSMGPAENAALAAWGANATTMSFGDVPPALQTGVIDGLLTSLGGYNQIKDQAPYFTVAGINGIVGDYYWVGASQVWWNKLSDKQREVIEKLMVEEVLPFQKKVNWCNDKRVIDQFGTEDPSKPGIYIMQAAEQKKLADALGDATTKWVKSNTPADADKWVDRFQEEAKAAVEKNPLGESWIEKTDCSEIKPWFDRFKRT
ncbi:TRAP-type C4-dicarboxylate transport system substrate-binding protein [Constrictibacter sp. MBR-5]|jgi:TRAP-type C4-dicarboxylate transport system substrate-binding protein|uniref:TRAP transporter substrate-binding protein n=1 Tax=Constrictibacter sp. MBR-5 TaxID=3156467 RepID=UPI003393AE45